MISNVQRLRLELTVLLGVSISIAALVLAIASGGGEAGIVEQNSTGLVVEASQQVPDDAEPVEIVNFRYSPDPIRVSAGQIIAWSNEDSTPHTVTADDQSWGSEYMAQGDTFVLTFDKPGVYVYYCELHPPAQLSLPGVPGDKLVLGGGGHGMQGRIIVE